MFVKHKRPGVSPLTAEDATNNTWGGTGLRLKTPSYVLLLVTGLAWLITYKQHRRHPRLHWAKCVSLHPENAPLDVDCRAFINNYLTRKCCLIILSSEISLLLKTLCLDIAKKIPLENWRYRILVESMMKQAHSCQHPNTKLVRILGVLFSIKAVETKFCTGSAQIELDHLPWH